MHCGTRLHTRLPARRRVFLDNMQRNFGAIRPDARITSITWQRWRNRACRHQPVSRGPPVWKPASAASPRRG
jgi:hypothetical protein